MQTFIDWLLVVMVVILAIEVVWFVVIVLHVWADRRRRPAALRELRRRLRWIGFVLFRRGAAQPQLLARIDAEQSVDDEWNADPRIVRWKRQ